MYKIEKNIPIPPENKGGKSVYPFESMETNDSFFIECNGEAARKIQTSVINAANAWRKRNDLPSFKLRTHLYDTGLRVWRVK